MKPSARSTKYLRDRGFIVCKVEQRLPIPGKFVTRDAFNFGDLLIAKPGWGIALLQETAAAKVSNRFQKIAEIPEAKPWLAAGGRILVHGWRKGGPRGARKVWKLTEWEVFFDDASQSFVAKPGDAEGMAKVVARNRRASVSRAGGVSNPHDSER